MGIKIFLTHTYIVPHILSFLTKINKNSKNLLHKLTNHVQTNSFTNYKKTPKAYLLIKFYTNKSLD